MRFDGRHLLHQSTVSLRISARDRLSQPAVGEDQGIHIWIENELCIKEGCVGMDIIWLWMCKHYLRWCPCFTAQRAHDIADIGYRNHVYLAVSTLHGLIDRVSHYSRSIVRGQRRYAAPVMDTEVQDHIMQCWFCIRWMYRKLAESPQWVRASMLPDEQTEMRYVRAFRTQL